MNSLSVRSHEDELVRSRMRLVHQLVSDAATRLPRHVSRDDLLAAGMLGLAQAARSFDPGQGVAFDKHASNRIRGALLDELRALDWASRTVRAKARRLEQATERLCRLLGRTPTDEELGAELALEPGEVRRLAADLHRATIVSYEAVQAEGSTDDLLRCTAPGPAEILLRAEHNEYLGRAIELLPERLRTVVVGSFLDERSMRDLAIELGVTESRISQLRSQALALLADGMNSQLDPDLLAPEQHPGGRTAKRRAGYFAAIAASGSTRRATPCLSREGNAGADAACARDGQSRASRSP